MLTEKRGEEGAGQIKDWADQVISTIDKEITVAVNDDYPDSNTFLVRLGKRARVLLFRLSYAQAQTDGREAECERTLKRKIRDLENMI